MFYNFGIFTLFVIFGFSVSNVNTQGNVLASTLNGLTNGLTMSILGTNGQNVMPINTNIVPLTQNVVPINTNIVPLTQNVVPINTNVMPLGSNIVSQPMLMPLKDHNYRGNNFVVYPIQNINPGNSVHVYKDYSTKNHKNRVNPNIALTMAETQRLYERLRKLNQLKEQNKRKSMHEHNNKNELNQGQVPIVFDFNVSTEVGGGNVDIPSELPNPGAENTTEVTNSTSSGGNNEDQITTDTTTSTTQMNIEFKSLTKKKFYFQMYPIIPENEENRTSETIYYLD